MLDEETLNFHIDGKEYSLNDLTFREQLALRPLLREIVPDEFEDPPVAAVMAATVCVIQRRSEPEYTIDQALDLDWNALEKKNGSRPTRRGKTAATSGSQSSTP